MWYYNGKLMIITKSDYISKRMFCWLNKKVIVKNTKKYGMGIYSTQVINKDEKIAMFGGYVMTRKEEEETPEEIYDNAIQIDEDLVIGAKFKTEIEDASMFNHSCNANAGIRGQILLVAIKEITPNEQITLDFGTVLFHPEGVKPYVLKCLCNSKHCRGTITDDDWKKEVVQKKYTGYFPIHIQDKIDKLQNK